MMTLEHEVILSSESNETLMEYPVHLVSVWKSTGAQGKRSECLPKGGATVEEASVFFFLHHSRSALFCMAMAFLAGTRCVTPRVGLGLWFFV